MALPRSLATALRTRRESYGVFEMLAWPAVVWSAVEIALRTSVMEFGGLADATLILACAAMTVGVCRHMRRPPVRM